MGKHSVLIYAALTLFLVVAAWAQRFDQKDISLPNTSISQYFENGTPKYTDASGGSLGFYGTGITRINTNLQLNNSPYYIQLNENNKEIVSAEMIINATVAYNNSIEIYTTTNSSQLDPNQAWNAVTGMTQIGTKTSSGSEPIQIDNSTFLGWLDDTAPAKRIYFGFKQSDENNGSSTVISFTIRVYYKNKYSLILSFNQIFNGYAGSYDKGTEPINLSAGGVNESLAEDTEIGISLSPTVSNGGTQYAFSYLKINNAPQYEKIQNFTFTGNTTIEVYYIPGVSVTLDNQVQFLAGGSTRINGSQISATNNGALIQNVTVGNSVVVPQDINIDYKTLYGINGEKLDYTYNSTSYKIKHQNWSDDLAIGKLTYTKSSSGVTPLTYTAKYHELRPATLKLSLDGILQNNIPMQFKDPWRVVSGTQPGNWDNYNSGTNLGIGNDGSTIAGVFQSVTYLDDTKAHYRVKTDLAKTIDGSNANFYNWQTSNAFANSPSATETPIKFDAANATVTAVYKGHLRTGRPDLADTKNQRRLISSVDNNKWTTVYESMGDIWLTKSDNVGVDWYGDVRLNITQGVASNPTISNILLMNGYQYFLVAWVETEGGVSTLHFQSLQSTGGLHWGWKYYSDNGQDETNHRTLNEVPMREVEGQTGEWPLLENARPVVQLIQSGSAIHTYIAYEGSDYRLKVGYMITPTLGEDISGSYLYRPGITGPYIRTASVYTAMNPVIITYPSTYGYPAKTFIYFISGGYAAGKRIAYYDYGTQTESVLANPNNDYTYNSLQGAVSPGNNTYGLVAEHLTGINYYYKPTYMGSSAPMLATVFSNMKQSSLMFDQSSSFGTLSSVGTPVMKSTSDNQFYQYSNSSLTAIGPNIAGIFNKEQTIPGDRTSIVVKTTSSPATVVKYSGSGLAKSAGTSVVNKQIVRIVENEKGEQQRIALDISNANVEEIDSLEQGSDLCVVKVYHWNNSSIRQIDSIIAPLKVTVKRDGKRVRSFNPSEWKSLTAANLTDVNDGDVITFSLQGERKKAGFTIVTLTGSSLAKDNINAEALIPTEKNISVYPNPFNPTTTFRVSLPQSGYARLAVYNMLGQKVATVVDGEMPAGYNSIQFDGSILSSGMYLYRLEIHQPDGGQVEKYVQSGKILLMK